MRGSVPREGRGRALHLSATSRALAGSFSKSVTVQLCVTILYLPPKNEKKWIWWVRTTTSTTTSSSTCPWRSPELGAAQRHGQPPQRLHRHQGLAGLKSRRRDGGRARGVRRQPPRDPYNLKKHISVYIIVQGVETKMSSIHTNLSHTSQRSLYVFQTLNH